MAGSPWLKLILALNSGAQIVAGFSLPEDHRCNEHLLIDYIRLEMREFLAADAHQKSGRNIGILARTEEDCIRMSHIHHSRPHQNLSTRNRLKDGSGVAACGQ